MSNSNFPLDVATEIFLRLPVKSLVRFKFVCKSWYALIRSPNFISEHLKITRTSLLHHHHETVKSANDADFPYFLRTKSTLTLFRRGELNLPVNLRIPFSSISKEVEILGSCNGLVCVSLARSGSVLLLWNPATGEFRASLGSSSIPETPPGMKLDKTLFGFGFDPKTNDYKLVKFMTCSLLNNVNVNSQWKVEIYSASKDCWREIKEGIDMFFGCSILGNSVSAVVSDGVMYFLMMGGVGIGQFITSFDMRDEVCRKTVLPSFCSDFDHVTSHVSHCTWAISVFRGSLAAMQYCTCGLNLWVFRESWTKLVVEATPKIERPLGIWEDGEILCRDINKSILLYNPKTLEIHNLSMLRTKVEECWTKSAFEPIPNVNMLAEFKRLVGYGEDDKFVYEGYGGNKMLYDPKTNELKEVSGLINMVTTSVYTYTESLVPI